MTDFTFTTSTTDQDDVQGYALNDHTTLAVSKAYSAASSVMLALGNIQAASYFTGIATGVFLAGGSPVK